MSSLMEAVEELLTQDPPRDIPEPLRRKVRWGRPLFFFGLCFGLFGMVFVVIFFPWGFHRDLLLDLLTPELTDGEVLTSAATSFEVNEVEVYAIDFSYVAGGARHERTSYLSGAFYEAGDRVPVEYLLGAPGMARIRDARSTIVGYWGMLVVLFPAIGFGLLVTAVVITRRRVGLLRNGIFARARVTRVESAKMEVNDRPGYRILFAYDVDGTEHVGKTIAFGEVVELARERQREERDVGVLYDVARPSRVLFIDGLLA